MTSSFSAIFCNCCLRLMIPVHFLHVHIGMLHRMLLTGRSTVFFELLSFIDSQPVMWIELFESANEGFLICICTYRFKYGRNLVDMLFLCTYRKHVEQMALYTPDCDAIDMTFFFLRTQLLPNRHSFKPASPCLLPSCMSSRFTYRKHRCIISITLSCCSGVILLSLGKHSPRRKISAPTSIPEPFM